MRTKHPTKTPHVTGSTAKACAQMIRHVDDAPRLVNQSGWISEGQEGSANVRSISQSDDWEHGTFHQSGLYSNLTCCHFQVFTFSGRVRMSLVVHPRYPFTEGMFFVIIFLILAGNLLS